MIRKLSAEKLLTCLRRAELDREWLMVISSISVLPATEQQRLLLKINQPHVQRLNESEWSFVTMAAMVCFHEAQQICDERADDELLMSIIAEKCDRDPVPPIQPTPDAPTPPASTAQPFAGSSEPYGSPKPQASNTRNLFDWLQLLAIVRLVPVLFILMLAIHTFNEICRVIYHRKGRA